MSEPSTRSARFRNRRWFLPLMCLWLRLEMGKEHRFWRNTSIPWTCKVRVPMAPCQIAGFKMMSMSQLDIAKEAYAAYTFDIL